MEKSGAGEGRRQGTGQGSGSVTGQESATEALKLRVATAQLDFLRLVARAIVQARAEKEHAAPAAGGGPCGADRR
ncbi:MAG: hypothetical protein GXY74_02905 [Phycisphaerae bacterium]|mgnify:FL=1|nr:hypothetical protein [Phycisphaerae bacterium]